MQQNPALDDLKLESDSIEKVTVRPDTARELHWIVQWIEL